MAGAALQSMQCFYSELLDLYGRFNIKLEGDLGRRNMLMSSLQEKTFAEQIKNVYETAHSDGKTGEPDIVIPEINSELECKLTSKNKSGSWQLQTDYNTLTNKKELDYLYVLASADFSEFAVLFFEGLTCDDFHFPSPGSKGKSRMKLSVALKKCIPIYGTILDKSLSYIEDASATLSNKESTVKQLEKAEKRLKYWRNTTSVSFILEAA
jgi:hypothetical protein